MISFVNQDLTQVYLYVFIFGGREFQTDAPRNAKLSWSMSVGGKT